jgi:hypothetical protein
MHTVSIRAILTKPYTGANSRRDAATAASSAPVYISCRRHRLYPLPLFLSALAHTRVGPFYLFLPVGSSWQDILRGCRGARAGSRQKLMMGIEGGRPREDTLHVHTRSLVTGMVFSFFFCLIMSYIGQKLSGGDVPSESSGTR